MGTATTYSTARSPLRRGASSVLSDCVHNLSEWASWRPHASPPPTWKVSLPDSLAPWPRSGPRSLIPGRHGGISPVTDDGNHRGCTRARPPRGDRALYRYRPDLRSVCAAPRHHEADAGDGEQANERDGNAGVRAGAGKLVAVSARAARGLRLLRSRLGLLGSGLRLLRSRLGLLGSRLGLRHSSSSPRSSRAE